MNLAFSNIAWSPEEDQDAYRLLAGSGISLLEAAPGRLWGDLSSATKAMTNDTRRQLEARGMSVTGFQAILFGRPDLQLFDDRSRPELLSYLRGLSDLCASVGGRYLVFGAPKNRWVPEAISSQKALVIAADFFKELGKYAQDKGVVFGIEANPAHYGCNFCTTIKEVVSLVRAVDSPGVRWHLDSGEMAMNKELLPNVICENADLIGSVHISEPNLGGFSEPWGGHSTVAEALNKVVYSGALSIEMKRQPDGLKSVEDAVKIVSRIYGVHAG
jgi:sugar phosphate isomerase/epimerase